MENQGTKLIETDRLLLRRFRMVDADAMYQNWASDPEVTKFLTWTTHGNVNVTKYLLSDWVKRYEESSYYNWVMELKETGEIIGNIYVVKLREDISAADMGYCMGRAWWASASSPAAPTRRNWWASTSCRSSSSAAWASTCSSEPWASWARRAWRKFAPAL